MDTKIKVLLANEQSGAHQAARELLLYQEDMELVGIIHDPIELLLAVEETQAEVVLLTLSQSGEIPGICTHLLTEYPDLLILDLSVDLENACLYRRGIVAEPLSKISEASLEQFVE